jgi:hypothetical protein
MASERVVDCGQVEQPGQRRVPAPDAPHAAQLGFGPCVPAHDHPLAAPPLEGLAIERTGALVPGPDAQPWTPRWRDIRETPQGWRLDLERRGDVFELTDWAPDPQAPGPAAPTPASNDSGVATLLERAAIRDAIARLAWEADRGAARRHILGNQHFEREAGRWRVETSFYRVEPGSDWGDGAGRLSDELTLRDGLAEVATRKTSVVHSGIGTSG